MTSQTDQAFSSLEEIYSYFEAHAADYKYDHQIGDLFRSLRDKLHEAKRDDETTKAQWEIDVFNFVIRDNELKSKFSGTNDKGEPFQYPDIKYFTEETYAYFKERLSATSNPLLKTRYAHFLWLSPQKHQSFAKIAVDGYLQLIDIYEAKDKQDPNHHYGLDVLKCVENAYRLAKTISYRLPDISTKIKQIIHQYSYQSTSSFVIRHHLIEIMLRDNKLFISADYESLPSVSLTVSENLVNATNLHAAIDMLKLNIRIFERLGKDHREWAEKIAQHYEVLMLQAESQNNLASMTFCQQALKEYRKLGEQKKVEELEKKFVALKSSARLQKFETTIDLTEHIENCLSIAKKVSGRSGEEIIMLLMLDKSLLPRYEAMDKRAEKHEAEFVLQSIFGTEVMDQTGNPIQHFSTPEEKRYYNILNAYGMEINYSKIYLIDRIFLESTRAGKLIAPFLLDFLSKHSWFGKTLSKTVANNTTTYNWLNLLAPAIHEYFWQMGIYFDNPGYSPNFVLCIDSLVLKFEGLFRDICRLFGLSTSYFTKDNTGRDTVQEKDIHALLYEDKVKELFDKDDLLLFKAVLIEKAAYNLRHRVAHALLSFEEYGFSQMNLLLMALLRIGKYDFTQREASEKEDSEGAKDIASPT
jgi:hypothetical protein